MFSLVSYFDVFENWECHKEWHPNSRKKLNKHIIGALYRLKNDFKNIDSSISFSPSDEKLYRLKAIIKNWNGLKMNSIIMKQVKGATNKKLFSITKEQCSAFHIAFEHGLEIYSSVGNHFQRIIERFPNQSHTFNPNDLSTYIHHKTDGTVRGMLLQMDGDFKWDKKKIFDRKNKKNYKFIKISDSVLKTKRNVEYKLGGIEFKSKIFIKTPNGKVIYHPGDTIAYRLITRDLISENDHSVYIELILSQATVNLFTEDGVIGADKNQFKNLRFDDIFEIVNLKK